MKHSQRTTDRLEAFVVRTFAPLSRIGWTRRVWTGSKLQVMYQGKGQVVDEVPSRRCN